MATTIGKSLVGSAVANYNTVKSATTAATSLATDYTTNQVFQFPSDLNITNNPAFIQFQFAQYVRPSILVTPTTNDIGSVVLPIPSQKLADQISLNYSTSGASDTVTGALLNGVAGQVAKGSINFQNTSQAIASTGEAAGIVAAGNALNSITKNVLGVKTDLNSYLQIGGMVVNPYLTVMFQSPNFKRYTFSWIFVPENPQDSLNLRYIINKFRYHSLPDIATFAGYSLGQNSLLGYPDMVKPVLYPKGYQFDFKWCVIEAMEVDYIPGDTPAYFAGTNAPVSIRFTVSLLEIEYWLKEDIVASTYSS